MTDQQVQVSTFKLPNGDAVPVLGLGTWKMVDAEAYQSVKAAIELGYRHIDGAFIYGNESFVGQAIDEVMGQRKVTRDELWITSKLWNNSHRSAQVRVALRKTLQDLRLDYLDLYLMHWPVALKEDILLPETGDDYLSLQEVPLLETWQAMQDCRAEGLCRHIGVANFSQQKLQHLIDEASVVPAMNQVESHPFLQQNELLQFCQQHQIGFTAYSPLGSGDRPDRLRKDNEPPLLSNSIVVQIADQHESSPAQVLLAWAVQRGTIPIPKSSNPSRLRENLASLEIHLSPADMQSLAGLDQHYRYIDGKFWEMPGSTYTANSVWDEPAH